jgi:hypothetical protein
VYQLLCVPRRRQKNLIQVLRSQLGSQGGDAISANISTAHTIWHIVRLMFGVCKKLLFSIRVKNYQDSTNVKKSSLPYVFRDSSSPTLLPSLHFRILSPPATSLPGDLFYHLSMSSFFSLPLRHGAGPPRRWPNTRRNGHTSPFLDDPYQLSKKN